MAKPITISNTFQTQPGPIPLSQLDGNFTQVAGSLNDMGTYSNYLVDSGAVNALVVTTAVGLTFAYNAGMRIEVKVANTNTSTGVTINVNSLGAKTIVNPSGSALAVGQLVVGEIALLMYDGTNFQLLSASTSVLPPLTGPILLPDGTAGAPSLTFSADTDSGLYRIGSNEIGVSLGGVKVLDFSPAFTSINTVLIGTGSALSSGGASDGAIRSNANLYLTSGGGSPTLILDPTNHALFSDGNAGAPALAFSADTNTGIYHTVVADNLGIACGGTLVATFTPTQIQTLNGNIATGAGYAFNSNPLSGLYSSGSGQVGITVNGSGGLSLFDPSIGGNVAVLGFNSSTSLRFNCSGASSATTGASGAPPAQVAGYMTIQHNGSSFKIPYYNL